MCGLSWAVVFPAAARLSHRQALSLRSPKTAAQNRAPHQPNIVGWVLLWFNMILWMEEILPQMVTSGNYETLYVMDNNGKYWDYDGTNPQY